MTSEAHINELLDSFHRAAATGNGKVFFDLIDDAQGTYIGTDQEEHWTKAQFASFAMPYFDRGPAWDFKAVDRHVFFSADGHVAWFDEWLDTWMQGCRGSGVFVKSASSGEWKMEQYVLSMTMPDALRDAVAQEKGPVEAAFLAKRAEAPLKAGTPASAHAFLDGWHEAAVDNDASFQQGLAPDAFVVGCESDQYCRDHASVATLVSAMLQHGAAHGGQRGYQVVERHVYSTADKSYVWFDELYNGAMSGIRGSGVLHACGGTAGTETWCVQHLVFSLTIPNDMAKPLVPKKKELEGETLSKRLAARNAAQ